MVQNVPAQGPTPSFPVVSPATGAVYSGTTLLVPQFAVINVTGSGIVIPAVAGFIIRVLSMDYVTSVAVTIEWQTSTGPTLISGPQAFAVNGGIVRPFNQAGWFQTNPGDALLINLSGPATVGGDITYVTL